MTNKTIIEPIVKVYIRLGPVTPVQRQAEKRLWLKLIKEAKNEVMK